MSNGNGPNIIEATTTELHGVAFVGLAVYKDGRHVDTITKEPECDDDGFSVILEAAVVHELGPIELRTDSEVLFRQTVTIPGIHGRLVSPEELSVIYRELSPGSESYRILCELYKMDDDCKLSEREKLGWRGWIGRMFNRIKKWLRTALSNMRGRFE